MHIPRAWARSSTECTSRGGGKRTVSAWGWGDREAEARQNASTRLSRLVERLGRGEPLERGYEYGSRPLREEILESLDGTGGNSPLAILTRNRYGAQVLNTSGTLFLDIDLAPDTLAQRLRRLVSSSASAELKALARLREALVRYGRASFRVYRTAAGFRAVAVDRAFNPSGREAQELMAATGTDPAFARLCVAQQSFRARLTPKPWRCKCSMPPGDHPRSDEMRRRFADWLSNYERASSRFATCRFVETVGTGRPEGDAQRVIALHDRLTRCEEQLPLA
jgi:hypothetical protein